MDSSQLKPRAKTYVFREDYGDSCEHVSEDDAQIEAETIIAVTISSHRIPSHGTAIRPGKRSRPWDDAQLLQGRTRDCDDYCMDDEGGDDHKAVVRVVINEVLSEDFGLFTWPSGILLACLIWSRREEFKGTRVIEIGAGTALPGLLAAKLGASVVLTDREDAPWVLDNMRGAIAANGESVSGSCTVAGLSWGNISPTAVKLATEHPLPRYIFGADVFYSSEHFDAVLATAYLFLSSSDETAKSRLSAIGLGYGPNCGDVDNNDIEVGLDSFGTGIASNRTGVEGSNIGIDGKTTGMNVSGIRVNSSSVDIDSIVDSGGNDVIGSAGDRASVANVDSVVTSSRVGRQFEDQDTHKADDFNDSKDHRSSPTSDDKHSGKGVSAVSHSVAVGGASTRGDFESSESDRANHKCTFLTAYHERSARRSLRPLLRKWGLAARVLHDVPKQVLPESLWESGKYDSIALIEITLAEDLP